MTINCKEFQERLPRIGEACKKSDRVDADEDFPDQKAFDTHRTACPECEALFSTDQQINHIINKAFEPRPLPGNLAKKIDRSIEQEQGVTLFTRKKILAAAAIAAAVFVFALIFFPTSFQYQNLQQLSLAAVDSHLKGNFKMTFSADQLSGRMTMLSRELEFNVTVPDLSSEGYILLGGRLCHLGECRIVYLFYQKQDKIVSLMIMGEKNISFQMADKSHFSDTVKGYQTDIWKDRGQIYAMIH